MEQRLRILNKNKVLVIFIGGFVLLSFVQPHFFSAYNISSLCLQMPAYGMAAIGLTFILISGYLDISMGSIIAFSGVIFAIFANIFNNFLLAGMVTLIICGLIGAVTGFCVAYLKMDSFIVSLCAMIYVRGLALSLSGQEPVMINNEQFKSLTQVSLGPFPLVFFFLIVAAIIAEYFLRKTGMGRNLYALGGDKNMARLAGIKVKLTSFFVFVIYAILSGIGGLVLASRMNSGTAIVGVDAPLTIIPMLILGGTSLSGGKGGALQTLLGIALLSMIFNAMALFNVPPNLQELVKGCILLTIIVVEKTYENRTVKV